MKQFAKVMTFVWIAASVAALVLHSYLQAHLNTSMYKAVIYLAIGQLVFGLIINPLIKKWLQRNQDKFDLELARNLLGVNNK